MNQLTHEHAEADCRLRVGRLNRGDVWRKYPRGAPEMGARIRESLGISQGPYAEVPGPDGQRVRVAVGRVASHFLLRKRKGKRAQWYDVPLIGRSIEKAYCISGPPMTGERLYSAKLRVGYRGEKGNVAYVATYVDERVPGQRSWKTTFRTDRERLAAREKTAGQVLWTARSTTGHGNPTPTRRRNPGVMRSGRTPLPGRNSRAHEETPSIGLLLLALGGMLTLIHLANRRQVAVGAYP